ncbi:hypothetical protein X798_01703 [Onchocerca flexuosa]|uniref:Glutathione-dependent reductase n=2 Tax=Onchocerca flexuosa TaxID=387005 RepID=A0A183H2T6_9BILA|nr:hypothetical protein X798_01703 [Onchocerca flexuosa]VDO30817.1 unnamed protein product [Onchocerca flexuosa]
MPSGKRTHYSSPMLDPSNQLTINVFGCLNCQMTLVERMPQNVEKYSKTSGDNYPNFTEYPLIGGEVGHLEIGQEKLDLLHTRKISKN